MFKVFLSTLLHYTEPYKQHYNAKPSAQFTRCVYNIQIRNYWLNTNRGNSSHNTDIKLNTPSSLIYGSSNIDMIRLFILHNTNKIDIKYASGGDSPFCSQHSPPTVVRFVNKGA